MFATTCCTGTLFLSPQCCTVSMTRPTLNGLNSFRTTTFWFCLSFGATLPPYVLRASPTRPQIACAMSLATIVGFVCFIILSAWEEPMVVPRFTWYLPPPMSENFGLPSAWGSDIVADTSSTEKASKRFQVGA
uniref:Uncharacterized protein n=1 Tax=Ixodes ricinus TaxID=34613 RepID=A0A147BKK2_IXORI